MAREATEQELLERYGDMGSIEVTAPDGSKLETNAAGDPKGFSAPTKPAKPAES